MRRWVGSNLYSWQFFDSSVRRESSFLWRTQHREGLPGCCTPMPSPCSPIGRCSENVVFVTSYLRASTRMNHLEGKIDSRACPIELFPSTVKECCFGMFLGSYLLKKAAMIGEFARALDGRQDLRTRRVYSNCHGLQCHCDSTWFWDGFGQRRGASNPAFLRPTVTRG